MRRVLRMSRFGSLMDIDKLIQKLKHSMNSIRFGSLMDIDKLIQHIFCR